MTPKRTKEDPTEEDEIVVEDEESTKVVTVISVPEDWEPVTELGRMVKNGEITDINQILDSGRTILEQEITDSLLPNIEIELINIGQSKGKFGGGKRRAFRQTQKKTNEGNKPYFGAYCVVGNKDGIIGIGYGKAKEVVPAREKSVRNAKKNLFRVIRGSGSWETLVPDQNSIPFKVKGKAGSVVVELMPAPKGTGIVAEPEIAKILKLAGIQDVWANITGHAVSKINVVLAAERALKKLSSTKVKEVYKEQLGITVKEKMDIPIAEEE
ncbi:MAG: 30S ribosomal protein S5 [Candidatus Woesearchaeota archaeon]